MARERCIRKILKAKPTLEGAGVHLKRVFGYPHVPTFDPFLLLDDFHSDDPEKYLAGFPWHPHRGIETITYMIEGEVEHGDSLGNSGVIRPGDVQWMTAGSGIVHQEMPSGDDRGRMWGLQLWANLPAREKMTAPRYRDVTRADIPLVNTDSASVRVLCGEFDGVSGPVDDVVVEPAYLDVTLKGGGTFERDVPRGHTVFAYGLSGHAAFCGQEGPFEGEVEGAGWSDMARPDSLGPETLALFGPGDTVTARAGTDGARFLLISGKPLGEPVAWGGPIVMNTRAELQQAFRDYETGNFL